MSNSKDSTALKLFRKAVKNAQANGICRQCKAPIRDERGEDAEASGENGQIYSNAGMCETCHE